MTQGLDIIYNIFIWVNPIYLPLIIFFLGFTSRECLFLNTVFLLIVSLYRFKVPAIFLYCDEKFFFLYWPDELSLRNFNKGSQPLCCLQVFVRFWGNVDILYHHNILIFWINPGQSKQILVHLLVSDVVSLEINKVIRHLSEHDFFQLDLPVKDGKLILLTQFFEPIIVFLDFSLRQKWCVVAVFIPVLLVQSDKLEFRLFFLPKCLPQHLSLISFLDLDQSASIWMIPCCFDYNSLSWHVCPILFKFKIYTWLEHKSVTYGLECLTSFMALSLSRSYVPSSQNFREGLEVWLTQGSCSFFRILLRIMSKLILNSTLPGQYCSKLFH